jgi:hypothetical protein
MVFSREAKPVESIEAEKENLTSPLALMPVAEKKSLDTSIPTNKVYNAQPP